MIFIDCGFYAGNALKSYKDRGIVDKAWTIYAFEPNPLLDIVTPIETLELPVRPFQKAVWTSDGEVTFQIGGRDDASSVLGTGGHGDPQLLKVPSIDFSKFVTDLPDEFIICSMDIEGAEFSVLEKMLEDGTIDKINILDVEFHHRLMENKTLEDAQELLIKLLTKTAVRLKVNLI